MCTVQVCFLACFAGAADGAGSAGTAGQVFSASWQNTYFEMVCYAPSKACSVQIENERMCSHHKDSNFSRIRFFFFLPLYGNAGMINNQHISVAAFVLYSLNLLGCHLFILNLRRNKYRKRGCSNPGASERGSLPMIEYIYICILYFSVCLLHENISLKHKRGLHFVFK